jgi:hypothetical protein
MEKKVTRVEQIAAVGGALVITAVIATGGWLARQHNEAAAVRAAQRAETLRIQRAMLAAARGAEAAWIATTPLEVRTRQQEEVLREFRAAEAEMLRQQTLARLAREAREANVESPKETGR